MLDIKEFINDFDYKLYGDPATDYRICCPFCKERYGTDDIKYKLHISIEKNTCHCFRCGYTKSWLGLVMDYHKCSYQEAAKKLYKVPKLEQFDLAMMDWEKPAIKNDVELPKDFVQLKEKKKDLQYRKHCSYLRNRGFGQEYWKRYNLGVAESVPGRVIIPIENGYWQGRAIHRWLQPRYLNPKTQHGHYLFNSLALMKYKEVGICEGAFSAMAFGDNAIALLGKEPVKEKVDRLIYSPVERFILAVEPEAWGTMNRLAKILQAHGKEVIIWKFFEGDPADHGTFEVMPYDFKTTIALSLS